MTGSVFKYLAIPAVACFTFPAAPAAAQTLDDKVWVEVSGYWADIETVIQVSSVARSTLGTEIDGESDLGLDSSEFLPKVLVGARLGGNWVAGAEYFSLRRDTTLSIARDITFDDVTYPAAASVTSEFNTDIYRFTIGYAFVRNPNLEIGGALGVHATNVEVSIEGQGSIGGASAQFTRRSRQFLAPLPTVGLFGTYRIAPRLTAGGRLDYMSLTIGDYDGRLINAEASIAYRLFRNVGVGAAWRLVDYRVGVNKERYTGRLDYNFSGPTVFLQVGF